MDRYDQAPANGEQIEGRTYYGRQARSEPQASRNGTHGRWYCFVASTGTSAGTGNRIVSSRTVGATSVHGVAVWHVQSNEKNVVGIEKVDYFIAQADDRLIRMVEVLTHVPENGVTHDTATSDFSLYGESVSVQFPTACS
jgi:hypothetical protein